MCDSPGQLSDEWRGGVLVLWLQQAVDFQMGVKAACVGEQKRMSEIPSEDDISLTAS